ncbi:hypothetical protein ACC691_11720 [Rhizobium johnstonii]|uniref:hypothetical protein n=1 Tax=Rhizobium johnstonii TaxID=3019933 RepID=UPI003F998E2E
MNPGSVFFDDLFQFKDGDIGEKLFVVLGSNNATYVVAKTTSNGKWYSANHGCQPADRFHNFHLSNKSCALKGATWVCLNEFYELNQNEVLQKKFSGGIKPVCDLSNVITRAIQDCACESEDITTSQLSAIQACLVI